MFAGSHIKKRAAWCVRRKGQLGLRSGPFGRENELFVTRGFTHVLLRDKITKAGCGLALKTCYAIIKEAGPEGSETKISLVLDATGTRPLSFSTLKEARTWLRIIKTRKRHKDVVGTVYSVVNLGSARFSAAYKGTFGRARNA
jgi:hypothetical protein